MPLARCFYSIEFLTLPMNKDQLSLIPLRPAWTRSACIGVLLTLGGFANGADAELQSLDVIKATVPAKISFRDQLQAIRETSATPEELVKRTAALLTTQPRKAIAQIPLRPTPVAAAGNLSEDARLRIEARNAVLEIRNSAKTPQEQAKLVDEFQHLNADTLASLRAPKLTAAQLTAARQATRKRLQAQVAATPDDIMAQAALVMFEIRQQANSPEQVVTQTEQFLRLNRKTIQEYQRQSRPISQSIQPIQ